jgi:hypothetical protein
MRTPYSRSTNRVRARGVSWSTRLTWPATDTRTSNHRATLAERNPHMTTRHLTTDEDLMLTFDAAWSIQELGIEGVAA